MHDKVMKIYKYIHTRKIMPFAWLLFLFLTLSSTVYAHKVYLFAWVEGDMIHTDSYFPDKRKVIGGLVEVFDPSGKKLLEGKTDKKGAFSFKIPKKTDLRIVLDATMGHKTEYLLSADEILEITVEGEPTTKRVESKIPLSTTVQVEMEQIRIILEDALDSRLTPISKTLAKIKKERAPGITEIVGGIGYIFGLMGLILYFKNRKKP